jgi:hypothetical protein
VGRACTSNGQCPGGGGLCSALWPYFLEPELHDDSRGELFLEGNLFLDETGAPYVRPYTELDPQWDWMDPGAPAGQGWLRPRRLSAADGTTWWDERRLAPFQPRPWVDPAPIPPAQVPAQILPQVGASLPWMDAVDAAIVGTWTVPAPWAGPDFVYPDPTATPWPDVDEDGLDDGWEMAHFAGLGAWALGDWDGDGYVNIEEWMNGSDPKAVTWGFLLPLFGTASGGQVSVTVSGVQVAVGTLPGQSATSVLEELATALEEDPTLSAQGIAPAVAQNTLALDRVVEQASVLDAGLRTRLDPGAQGAQTPLPAAGAVGLGLLALALAVGGALASGRAAGRGSD